MQAALLVIVGLVVYYIYKQKKDNKQDCSCNKK